MKNNFLHIITSSLIYYKKAVSVQIIIIAILSAVITGSLLTGFSVRRSLMTTAFERMGNTSILVSSGLRFFDPDMSARFAENVGQKTTSLLETNGFCQNFLEGTLSGKVKVIGIGPDFFRFHGYDSVVIKPGEIAINRKLAARIRVKAGEELILRLKELSDIPADAPFATNAPEGTSIVLKVGLVLEEEQGGDFSLGISQIVPSNIFINLDDLANSTGKRPRVNRIIAENNTNENPSFFSSALKKTLTITDLGLDIRESEMTGHHELVSKRIFIDKLLIDDIKKIIPRASPVITYLSNSINFDGRETPYSFVSAIPSQLYPHIVQDNGTVISDWLASDLGANPGDTIEMTWFAPDSINQLREKSQLFHVTRIVKMDSVWGDRNLMPEFPGIAGTESCSEWDAGVPVNMDKIREKDEDYWEKYKGTPKVFISYEKGKELWGSNYGPATAVRFPVDITSEQIENELNGNFDPERSGFIITNLRQEALSAANKSVDFGTLFISLGFFIILAAILLLSLSVSSWFESKKDHISTLFAIGFKNRLIYRMLLMEMIIIGFTGSLTGAILGLLVNNLIIASLNSVWTGAVQTNTLSAFIGIIPFITGLLASFLIILAFFILRTKNFLKRLNEKKSGSLKLPSLRTNSILLLISSALAVSFFLISVLIRDIATEASFASGILLFLSLILLLRHYYLGGFIFRSVKVRNFAQLSFLYYRHNPSQAITPAIFIAAGIFALFITSLNRMDFDRTAFDKKSGTGGYLFWSETGVPVNEDLSTPGGKRSFGLDEDRFKGMNIVQLARKEGDDASCLNLNHIASPPLLGIDHAIFAAKDAFSFASVINGYKGKSPWEILGSDPGSNSFYGIADQTVLDWGLKIKTGDTIVLRAESGQPVNIIIAAGLKSSVFQGNVLIDLKNLKRFFPSVSGSSVFLVNGDPSFSETYKSGLEERFSGHGIVVEAASERLASFYQVTNTYLSVFTVLGAFGMILGIFGLGFILLRNYNLRKPEFALMSATGFKIRSVRRSLLKDLTITMCAGIITGIIPALIATMPSVQANNGMPLLTMLLMIVSIFLTGMIILLVSVKQVKNEALIVALRKE